MAEGKKEEPVEETQEERHWWFKFTSINLFVLPFGNGGRGTPVRLFTSVGMAIFLAIIFTYDKFFAG